MTEVVIHLAYDDAEMQGATFNHPNWGAAWRQRDLEFFTSDAFRKVASGESDQTHNLEGIRQVDQIDPQIAQIYLICGICVICDKSPLNSVSRVIRM